MTITIYFDPWKERADAVRAQEAFKTLGIPVEIVEQRVHSHPDREAGPVTFEATNRETLPLST